MGETMSSSSCNTTCIRPFSMEGDTMSAIGTFESALCVERARTSALMTRTSVLRFDWTRASLLLVLITRTGRPP